MPYIVTTNTRNPAKDTREYDSHGPLIEGWDTSRRAVATLDEAREEVDRLVNDAYGTIGESGEWVGPIPTEQPIDGLPDGTVIEVKQVDRETLADSLSVPSPPDVDMVDPEWESVVIAAYNAAQEG